MRAVPGRATLTEEFAQSTLTEESVRDARGRSTRRTCFFNPPPTSPCNQPCYAVAWASSWPVYALFSYGFKVRLRTKLVYFHLLLLPPFHKTMQHH